MTTAFFFLFAGFVVAAALVVVLGRNLVHSAIALIFTFFGVAALYVLLDAEFLAAVQVLLYIGGITILLLFAIMLTQTKDAPSRLVFQTQAGPAAIASVVIAVLIALAIVSTEWGETSERIAVNAATMANVLFQDFVLPFEIVSVLLLAAVIGGVWLAKREPDGPS